MNRLLKVFLRGTLNGGLLLGLGGFLAGFGVTFVLTRDVSESLGAGTFLGGAVGFWGLVGGGLADVANHFRAGKAKEPPRL